MNLFESIQSNLNENNNTRTFGQVLEEVRDNKYNTDMIEISDSAYGYIPATVIVDKGNTFTDKAKEEFKDVLNLPVVEFSVRDEVYITVENKGEDLYNKLLHFVSAIVGQISETEYDSLFVDMNESALKEEDYEDEDYDPWEEIEYWDGNLVTEPDVYWREVMEYNKDLYREALRAREAFCDKNFGWGTLPGLVWELIDELLDNDCLGNPTDVSPCYMIDNMLVNGSYGDLEDFMRDGETEEEALARLEDEALRVYPDEKYVIYSL